MVLEWPALDLRGIDKRFAGVIALDHADLRVDPGTVHALLGENGAGKTTLMRIAYGMLRPDAGTVAIGGVEHRFRSPADAIAAGVGMVHQHYALVQAMTVADNVALGLTGHYSAREAADRVRALGAESGLALDPGAVVGGLSVEVQQRIEIVKALARDARILILDEPTAVLAPESAAEVLRWLRRFADGGRAVVLITHKLREALGVADRVTVLRRGRTVLTVAAAATNEVELARAMLGSGIPPDADQFADSPASPAMRTDLGGEVRPAGNRDASELADLLGPPALVSATRRHAVAMQAGAAADLAGVAAPAGTAVLVSVIVAQHITIADERGSVRIADASLTVRAGEILGVAAVEGEGQRELLRALAGRQPIASGRLEAPADTGFVPEDRQRDALVLSFPLYENVALRGAGRRRGRIGWGRVRARTRELLAVFDVRSPGENVPASTLSGGNQQKLVLARELEGDPRALVVENPTRGLDIQAMAAVHARLRAARDRGTAIVLYASDVDEVLALADRVIVIAQRRVSEVPMDRETVGRAMLGVTGAARPSGSE